MYVDQNIFKKYPLLNKEDELELLIKYQAGDELALDSLVRSNQLNVFLLTKKVHFQNLKYSFDDLFQEANFGLMKAILRFDVKSGNRLISYAERIIYHALWNFLANDKTVRVPQYRLKNPEFNTYSISIDGPSVDGIDDSQMTIMDSLDLVNARLEINEMDNENEYLDPDFALMDVLNSMKPKDLFIVVNYYGLFDVPRRTLKEIAIELNTSANTLSTRKNQQFIKLRNALMKDI